MGNNADENEQLCTTMRNRDIENYTPENRKPVCLPAADIKDRSASIRTFDRLCLPYVELYSNWFYR